MSDLVENTLASMDAEIAKEIDDLFQEYVNNIGEYIHDLMVEKVFLDKTQKALTIKEMKKD